MKMKLLTKHIYYNKGKGSPILAGLGFCHGKKYFCQDSGKNGKNWGKPAKTATYKIVQKHPNWGN